MSKTLKIVTRKYGDSDYNTECEYVFIEISDLKARQLALRGEAFVKAFADDKNLASLAYYDYTAVFFQGWDPDDFEANVLATHGDLEFFEREGYMVVGDDFAVPPGVEERLDFSKVVFTGRPGGNVRFHWESHLKHTEVCVESQALLLSILTQVI